MRVTIPVLLLSTLTYSSCKSPSSVENTELQEATIAENYYYLEFTANAEDDIQVGWSAVEKVGTYLPNYSQYLKLDVRKRDANAINYDGTQSFVNDWYRYITSKVQPKNWESWDSVYAFANRIHADSSPFKAGDRVKRIRLLIKNDKTKDLGIIYANRTYYEISSATYERKIAGEWVTLHHRR